MYEIIHRCTGRVSFRGGGGGLKSSCIFSIACTKIKWICPNITWFFCPKIAIWKILLINSQSLGLRFESAGSIVPLTEALYPHCLVPRKGLKAVSPPGCLLAYRQLAFLVARSNRIQLYFTIQKLLHVQTYVLYSVTFSFESESLMAKVAFAFKAEGTHFLL